MLCPGLGRIGYTFVVKFQYYSLKGLKFTHLVNFCTLFLVNIENRCTEPYKYFFKLLKIVPRLKFSNRSFNK